MVTKPVSVTGYDLHAKDLRDDKRGLFLTVWVLLPLPCHETFLFSEAQLYTGTYPRKCPMFSLIILRSYVTEGQRLEMEDDAETRGQGDGISKRSDEGVQLLRYLSKTGKVNME